MNSVEAVIRHGENLLENGRIHEALRAFEVVLERDPENVAALNDKGVSFNRLGKYEDAIDVFLKIVRIDRNNSVAVFNAISNCLSAHRLSEAEALLKAHESRLSRTDYELLSKETSRLKSLCGAGTSACRPPTDLLGEMDAVHERIKEVLSKDIFFIVGAPKSGTIWLQLVLDGHHEIVCSGEGDFGRFQGGLEDIVKDYNQYITNCNRNIGTSHFALFTGNNIAYMLITSLGLLLSNIGIHADTKAVGSKDPLLVKRISNFGSWLPTAKFIHIVRDGRDVVTSAWFNNLRGNREDTLRRWPDFRCFVEFGVHRWADDVRTGRSFEKGRAERYCEVKYEELHEAPDTVITRLLQFLGVDSSETSVQGCRNAGQFRTLSRGRDRGQEDQRAFFRKGVVGDWKNHFDDHCLHYFLKYGGGLLRDLGYS